MANDEREESWRRTLVHAGSKENVITIAARRLAMYEDRMVALEAQVERLRTSEAEHIAYTDAVRARALEAVTAVEALPVLMTAEARAAAAESRRDAAAQTLDDEEEEVFLSHLTTEDRAAYDVVRRIVLDEFSAVDAAKVMREIRKEFSFLQGNIQTRRCAKPAGQTTNECMPAAT